MAQWVKVASLSLQVAQSINRAWVKVAPTFNLQVAQSINRQWVKVAARTLNVPVSINQNWVKVATRTLIVPVSINQNWVKVASRTIVVKAIIVEPPPDGEGGGPNIPLILGGAALAAGSAILLANANKGKKGAV